MSEHEPADDRKLARIRRWTFTGATLAVCLLIVTAITPWPSAMLIRAVFELGGAATVEEMLPYVADTPLRERLDLEYGDAPSSTFDVFSPDDGTAALPTVVWIHGGAWISGSKQDVAPYLRILAAEGYTTVGLDYPIAPEAEYPTAFEQLNDALAYLVEHADGLRIDPDRIILAGDSAGAQLASQLSVLTTNPDYAKLMGITPALRPDQLDGVILHCGVYDMKAMAELNGVTNWGFKMSLWGYTGTKDWSDTYAGATMSSIQFATNDFPMTFISGGNGDSLTWIQSIPMANKLNSEGVDVTQLFWEAQHEPSLPHEYQFHLDYPEAHEALDATLAWLEKVS